MRLSKKGEYALRALLDLAMAQALDRALVPLSALAEAQKMPATFLEQILIELRQTGILASTRGKYGGYSLAKPASEIMIGDVVRMIDGPLAPIGCVSHTAYERCACPDEEHCGLRLIMMDVRNAIANVLDRFSLANLAAVTLQKLRRDGLLPPVVELIRHLSIAARPNRARQASRVRTEPEFYI
jgi:Rrf2 family protein